MMDKACFFVFRHPRLESQIFLAIRHPSSCIKPLEDGETLKSL
jgi:hypothetical protein